MNPEVEFLFANWPLPCQLSANAQKRSRGTPAFSLLNFLTSEEMAATQLTIAPIGCYGMVS